MNFQKDISSAPVSVNKSGIPDASYDDFINSLFDNPTPTFNIHQIPHTAHNKYVKSVSVPENVKSTNLDASFHFPIPNSHADLMESPVLAFPCVWIYIFLDI